MTGVQTCALPILRLYYAVRDELRYDPYNTAMKPEAYRASTTLRAGHGYCVNKAGLMAAVCRLVVMWLRTSA